MIGLYVHIPFCVKKCNYCDFYSMGNFSYEEEYFKTLKKEIEAFPKCKADTLFFGGGTPSAVNPKYIYDITTLIKEKFLVENSEITLEANPKTFNEDSLKIYKECGINRLSIGLQSASDIQLKKLGRIHTLKDFESSYNMARKCGFSNINIDIMYGLPNETKKELENTLGFVKNCEPEHISAYALTLSENTPIYKMGYTFPDSDEVFESYNLVCEALKDYRHYEISNFGIIPCKHNLKYWNMEQYAGFGASASGYFDKVRYTNKISIEEYIKDFSKKEIYEKSNDEKFEYIMLILRTDKGIDNGYLKEKYGLDLIKTNKKFLDAVKKEGYLEFNDDGFYLTEKGFFVSNSIISSLKI